MADSYAEMLVEKRQRVWDQAKALVDSAFEAKRELTADESQSYARMSDEMSTLRSRIDEIHKMSEDNKAAEETLRSLADKPKTGPDARSAKTNEELRKFLRGETRSYDVVRPEGSTGIGSTKQERRALSVGTATAGGDTVPIGFYGKLWQNMILTAQLINAGATVLETATGEALEIPATTAQSTAVLVAEGAGITESDPTFSQPTLHAYKYGVLLTVSRELITDTAVDLEGFLAVQAGRAVGNAFGTDLVSGNGSSKPNGLITQTTLGVTGATGVTGAPNFDNLINLYHAVIAPYRNSPSAAWFMNDLTAATIRILKDSYGQYLWQPSLVVGEPDSLLSKPVYTDPNMPTVALNAKSIAFGDLAAYFVRVAGNLRFEQSLDYAFNTDQVVFRCLLRGDGVLVDTTGAVKHFVGAAS